jgi:hypothetical protein
VKKLTIRHIGALENDDDEDYDEDLYVYVYVYVRGYVCVDLKRRVWT